MRHLFTLITICSILGISMLIGASQTSDTTDYDKNLTAVPYIGKLQILNGCGAEGAANTVAEYLRSHNFDVKYIGNAATWNYPFTLVVSRSIDTTVASLVVKELNTKKFVLIRNNENLYDVTVFIGPDFRERIQ